MVIWGCKIKKMHSSYINWQYNPACYRTNFTTWFVQKVKFSYSKIKELTRFQIADAAAMKGAYCLSNAGWASRPPAVGKLGVIVCSWLGSVQWMKSELNSKVFSCIRLSKSSLKSCFRSFRTCLKAETKENTIP